jgi:hypothetical protein
MADGITLTCTVGRFTFDTDVIISRTKLIRDSVMGQILTPRPGEPHLITAQDVYAYIRDGSCGRTLENVPFEFEFAVKHK